MENPNRQWSSSYPLVLAPSHQKSKRGQVRVGTCTWKGSKRIDPVIAGFTPIVCLTPSTKYGMLSPYSLTLPVTFNKEFFPSSTGQDETYECLVENIWQYSKVYQQVPAVKETKSRFDQTVIWEWPSQIHIQYPDGQNGIPTVTTEYMAWRKAGMTCAQPVRYPVGKRIMQTCQFSLSQTANGSIDPTPLNYIQARKAIYLPVYVSALKRHLTFHALRDRLNQGENLLILEVDGPQERSLPYYKEKYGVGDDFIQERTVLIDEQTLNMLLNDERERFGHGYCLAGALLDIY